MRGRRLLTSPVLWVGLFFAALMLRPWGPGTSAAILGELPVMLTWGAWWSGKSHGLPLAAGRE